MTFKYEVEAADEDAAYDAFLDGDYKDIGMEVGDSIDFLSGATEVVERIGTISEIGDLTKED